MLEILERASKSLIKSEELKKNISENTLSSKTLKKNYFVHESSYIDNKVKIGKGTKIWHFSHIQSNSQIGIDCTIGQNVNIASNVKVGNNVKIQNNVSVYEGVELEDFVFCGPSMVFTNVIKPRSEFPKSVTTPYQKTLVKRGATIGANATILCGLTLGKYSFVAAGAVVTSNVPDYALMKGVPSKRTAWVCQCGQKLSENISLFVCLECNRTYKLCNGTLS